MIKFSDKEILVFACMMQGRTNKEIARITGISVYVISTHLVKSILAKTRSRNRTQAAVWGQMHGIMEQAQALYRNGHAIEKVSGTQVR